MPTLPTTHESAPAAEQEFLAVVYADEDLLRVEFDAIIAGEWPSPPPDTPEVDAVERAPGPARRQPSGGPARPPERPHHPGVGGWSRQRSPPPATSHTYRQERKGDAPT